MFRIWILAVFCVATSLRSFAQSPTPLASSCPKPRLLSTAPGDALVKAGKYDEALNVYREQVASAKDLHDKALAEAETIRTLVRQRRIEDANAETNRAIAMFPNDGAVMSAAGGAAFLEGDIDTAARRWNLASHLDPCYWRVHNYLAYYLHLTGMHASEASQRSMAKKLGPASDSFVDGAERSVKVDDEPSQAQEKLANGSMTEGARNRAAEHVEYLKLRARTPCDTKDAQQAVTLPIFAVRDSPKTLNGAGIVLRINGKSLRFLLDSKVSGIILSPHAVEAAKVESVMAASNTASAAAKSFYAFAQQIEVGSMKFENCRVVGRLKNGFVSFPANVDGVIGLDVFASYLLTLDFPSQELRLASLPVGPGDPPSPLVGRLGVAGYDPDESRLPRDRYIAPDMQDWTRFYRYGNELIIPTRVNGRQTPRLFVLSTHEPMSSLSASQEKELKADSKGVPLSRGGYKRSVAGEQTELAFGNIVQPIANIPVRSTSGLTTAATTISGQLGFDALKTVTITIDYRDNLINFTQDKNKVIRDNWGQDR